MKAATCHKLRKAHCNGSKDLFCMRSSLIVAARPGKNMFFPFCVASSLKIHSGLRSAKSNVLASYMTFGEVTQNKSSKQTKTNKTKSQPNNTNQHNQKQKQKTKINQQTHKKHANNGTDKTKQQNKKHTKTAKTENKPS